LRITCACERVTVQALLKILCADVVKWSLEYTDLMVICVQLLDCEKGFQMRGFSQAQIYVL